MFSLSLFYAFTLYGNIFLDNVTYLPYYVIVTKRKEVYAMNFLSKLDALMADKELSKRQLAIESGIPYTTIVNWYKRGYGLYTFVKKGMPKKWHKIPFCKN